MAESIGDGLSGAIGKGSGKSSTPGMSHSENPLAYLWQNNLGNSANHYQSLYNDYFFPAERRAQEYTGERLDQVLDVARDTNPILDQSRKDLVRRLVEGEDVLADRYRSTASADTAQQFASQRASMNDRMSQLGINPSSGAWASATGNMASQEALAGASAMTQASRQAETDSLQRQQTAQQMYLNPQQQLTSMSPSLSQKDILGVTGAGTITDSTQGEAGSHSTMGSLMGMGVNLGMGYLTK